MPVGSSLERTDAKARQVEAMITALPEVENVSTWVGGAGQRNQAWLNISLVDRKKRSRSQKDVENAIREMIAPIPGTDASVGFNRPIYVAILGDDSEGLAKVATEFSEKVKKIPGIVDVELSVKPGLPAYAVRLKARRHPRTGADRAAGGEFPARLCQRRGRNAMDHARRQPGRRRAAPERDAA